MAALEGAAANTAPNVSGFVKSHTEGGDAGKGGGATAENPDEIDIGDDDSDDDDDNGGGGGGGGGGGAEVDVEQAAVPEGVFGGVKRAGEDDGDEPRGALDRFKKRRTAE